MGMTPSLAARLFRELSEAQDALLYGPYSSSSSEAMEWIDEAIKTVWKCLKPMGSA